MSASYKHFHKDLQGCCAGLITHFPNQCCVNPAALAQLSLRTAFIACYDAVAGWAMMDRLAVNEGFEAPYVPLKLTDLTVIIFLKKSGFCNILYLALSALFSCVSAFS